MASESRRDLVLAPGEYAYTRDISKGNIKVHVGPTVVNLSAQEEPIRFDAKKGFLACGVGEVIAKGAFIPENFYAVLSNPARDANKAHPNPGDSTTSVDLLVGERVNVAGPDMFAMWPGQSVQVIRGHQLGLSEYLLCRVTNEEKARANWSKAVAKSAATEGTDSKVVGVPAPTDLAVGTSFVIKGTDVSFYIPPTGVKVISDGEDEEGKEKYIRDALTLEQLEYAILVDQDGKKRYERGPKVVFPEPTENFMLDPKGNRKAKATELNAISGIFVRVIANYEIGKGDPAPKPLREGFDGKTYLAGDELFITGADTSLYFPREEHQLVSYDGKSKHFAQAIPEGEARYVLNRLTGHVTTVKGPKMFLADPRREVIIRRVLSEKQCELWYPGNGNVLAYNRDLAQLAATAPTTRAGTVSEGEVERQQSRTVGNRRATAQNTLEASSNINSRELGGYALQSNSRVGMVAEEVSLSSSYSAPRTLTLNTKLDGVVSVEVWNGYAVIVVNTKGTRRVEIGPKKVLLDYDESLEVLELSTGKPKTTDKTMRTVYLQVNANKVSDIIDVETSDHVKVTLKLAYRVGFEGEDTKKWFDVSNYVKLLCDHVRSLLKNAARKKTIEEFYKAATDIIRDTILGTGSKDESGKKIPRPGLTFEENSMKVGDVEVLEVVISDNVIGQALALAQREAVQSSLTLSMEERKLETTKRSEEIARQISVEKAKTSDTTAKLQQDDITRMLTTALKRTEAEITKLAEQKKQNEASELASRVGFDAELERRKITAAQELEEREAALKEFKDRLEAETKATTERFLAAKDGLSETVAALTSQETLVRLGEAMSVQQFVGGKSFADVAIKIFEGTPLAGMLGKKLDALPNGAAKLLNGDQTTGKQPRA